MKKNLLCIFALLPAFLGVFSSSRAADEADLPPSLAAVLADARRECASFENGKLTVEWGAVRRPDLDGDLHPDWALDMAFARCSTARTLFCGTGGCAAHFVVGDSDSAAEFLTKGWRTTNLGGLQVLLLQMHGANCGGTNLTPCFRALTWDAKARKWRGS